jgi:hypothetical protein
MGTLADDIRHGNADPRQVADSLDPTRAAEVKLSGGWTSYFRGAPGGDYVQLACGQGGGMYAHRFIERRRMLELMRAGEIVRIGDRDDVMPSRYAEGSP